MRDARVVPTKARQPSIAGRDRRAGRLRARFSSRRRQVVREPGEAFAFRLAADEQEVPIRPAREPANQFGPFRLRPVLVFAPAAGMEGLTRGSRVEG